MIHQLNYSYSECECEFTSAAIQRCYQNLWHEYSLSLSWTDLACGRIHKTQTLIDYWKKAARLKSLTLKKKQVFSIILFYSLILLPLPFTKPMTTISLQPISIFIVTFWSSCTVTAEHDFLSSFFEKQEVFCRSVEKIPYHCIINWKSLFFGSR